MLWKIASHISLSQQKSKNFIYISASLPGCPLIHSSPFLPLLRGEEKGLKIEPKHNPTKIAADIDKNFYTLFAGQTE